MSCYFSERVVAPILIAMASIIAVPTLAQEPPKPPAWAYTYNPPDFKPSADDGQPRHVPDSSVSYSVPQTRDRFLAPDWHPADHPRMPPVVAEGRKPDVYACGFCHRATGAGGPENADIAGLPTAYFIQQMLDYKTGKRSTALPDRIPQAWMILTAKASTDEEIKAAAEYFAAIKPKKLVDVVEAATVPKMVVAGFFFVEAKSGEREPVGDRIIETPADVARFANRDARVRFTAYVPPGSIAAGRLIAQKAEIACTSCHGEKLTGTESVPGIAGRSPTYLFRQLYDYRHGFRKGAESGPMVDAIKQLQENDLVPLAAYLASLDR